MKKIIAVFMTLTIVFSTLGSAVYAAEDDSEEYYGEVLAAINTSFTENASFSAYCKEDADREKSGISNEEISDENKENIYVSDIINDIEPLSPEEAELLDAEESRSKADCKKKVSEYKIGDKKEISDEIICTCYYIGKNCTIWYQDFYNNDEELNKKYAAEIGEWFDEMIPVELEFFGDKRIDTDGDGKIAVFFHEMSAGGYVQYSDFTDENHKVGDVRVSGNKGLCCDCIHILKSGYYSESDSYKSTMIHEYQHYIQFCYGYKDKTNRNYFVASSPVTEGFSTAAEYILADEPEYLAFFNIKNPLFDFESYSLEFFFFQYVRIRYAQLMGETGKFAGKGVYKEILERMSREKQDENKDVPQGFRIAADLLYPEESYPELETSEDRLKQLIIDFWTALFLNEDTGIHGFNGDEVSEYLYINFYNEFYDLSQSEDDSIYPGCAMFYNINNTDTGTAVIKEKSSDDIIFIAADNYFKVKGYYNLGDGSGDVLYTYSKNAGYFYLPDYYPNPGEIYVPGKTLKYWTVNGNKVNRYEDFFADADFTVCAVTEPAENITECGEYEIDSSEYEWKCYCFTPEVTGYYRIGGYLQVFDINNNLIKPAAYIYDENERYYENYELEAGMPCYIYCTDSFTISYQENTYTLTLDYNGVSDFENITLNGSDAYNIGYYIEYEIISVEERKIFTGWSKDRDAETAEYDRFAFVELTEDTTLYAVWDDVQLLKEGKNTTEEGSYYIFEAEKDGIYSFSGSEGNVINYYDNDEDNYYYYENYPIQIQLSAGEICVVCVYSGDITITECTAEVKSKITYCTREILKFKFYEGAEHTVISYKPTSIVLGLKFLGWSTDPNAAEPEYTAGDTLISLDDVTLYAVWRDSSFFGSMKQLRIIAAFPRFFAVAAEEFVFELLNDEKIIDYYVEVIVETNIFMYLF